MHQTNFIFMEYLKDLNKEQLEAVQCIKGPVMILAGAGSGKTRVLTYRIAYLINQQIDAFNILALTFTNKAANEMRERIETLVGADARNLWMGTFHSVFARLLRYEADKIGFTPNFTIYDTDDSKSLIKSILKEFTLDEQYYKPNTVFNRISFAKNNLISVKAYKENLELQSQDQSAGKPKIAMLYETYSNRCRKANAMDFDDLLFNTYILLNNFPEVLYKYQNKFQYILVDEYQDTNFVQYAIIKKLAAKNENICVVGDDAQSIYGFRGANIQNILSFEKDYRDLNIFKLEQNYRSTKTIVESSGTLISKNKNQFKKNLWTTNEQGEKIKLIRTYSDNEEGRIVADCIFEDKMQNQMRNNDFAILYRTNAQSRSFEEALRKLNINYRIYGAISFYQRKEIKDLLAYLRLTVNHNDEESFKRIINYPARGIGKTSIEKMTVLANEHNKSIWEVAESIKDYELGSKTQTAIDDFITMIKSFSVMLNSSNAYELSMHVAKSTGILKDLYNDKSVEGLARHENIQGLLNSIKEFTMEPVSEQLKNEMLQDKSLAAYLQNIALLTNADDKDNQEGDKVSLMTIHMAKGLEFPHVFIVGLEENLFPSMQSLGDRNDLEEERRLFYVAMTRAQKKLTLTYAENRYRWGKLNFADPSRFIDEIDVKHIDNASTANHAEIEETSWNTFDKPVKFDIKKFTMARKFNQPKKNLIPEPKNKISISENKITDSNMDQENFINLQVGMEVEHQNFGTGKVLKLEGEIQNQKATVLFPAFGQKKLLLKYAKLKII